MKAAAEGKKKEKKKQENAEKNEKIASEPERLTQSVHSDRRHGYGYFTFISEAYLLL